MLENIFSGLFDTASVSAVTPASLLLCIRTALIAGLMLTFCYSLRSQSSKSFTATLALLPTVVCIVIMMVNGNVGAGVAVAGAFSLSFSQNLNVLFSCFEKMA